MQDVTLYRKYRPQEFETVRGQEHITSVLKAAIEKGKPGHAYLFSGSRGTGKTSTARIFAKALGTDPKDLYEFDAASNTGVDDMREILDGVATRPFASEYKVYIVDEVHMLSKAAFNAFLKTLEEPPAFVIFILATTELEKVPETIQSRCQVFTFKKPTRDTLKEMIMDVAKGEGASLAPQAAELIALMGDGSYRDTLSILQKVLTVSSDKKLTEEEVATVIGAPKAALVNGFISALAKKHIEDALKYMHEALEAGVDLKVFIMLVVEKVRAILLIRFGAADMKELAFGRFGVDDTDFLKELSGKEGGAINSTVLAELITALADMGRSPLPEVPLELALYRVFEK